MIQNATFTFFRRLFSTPGVIVTSVVRHTKRMLRERRERQLVRAFNAQLQEQLDIEERSRHVAFVPAVRVEEVEVDGTWTRIVNTPEVLRFTKKAGKYVQDAAGDLIAVAKGKQFRYVAA